MTNIECDCELVYVNDARSSMKYAIYFNINYIRDLILSL